MFPATIDHGLARSETSTGNLDLEGPDQRGWRREGGKQRTDESHNVEAYFFSYSFLIRWWLGVSVV